MKTRIFLALLALLLATPAQAQQRQPANVSTLPTTSPQEFDLLDKTGAWVPFFPGAKDVFVRNYGPSNDWVGDDGPAIAAALAAASAAGGGTVYLDQKSYWNQTQALVVPKNVTLRCVGAFTKSLDNATADVNIYTSFPCAIYQAPGISQIKVSGKLVDMGLLQDRVHFLNMSSRNSRADVEAYTRGFAGWGIAVTNHQAIIDNILVGGFATCIVQSNGANETHINNVLGDCTNGIDISNSADDNFLSNIEFFPFLTAANPFRTASWTIAGLADNGSGLWRVTISAPDTTLASGEQIWISPGATARGAQGLWTITVIDSTHFDLQGSAAALATPITMTGNTTVGANAGFNYVTVASTDNLAPGMNVSGTNIPVGATIAAVWRSRLAISLDQTHPATANGTGVSLTFTNTPYTSGGTATYDGTMRMGTAFAIGQADGTLCTSCFDFGYLVGFNFRQAVGTGFINVGHDQGANHLANQNALPIGIEFTGVGPVAAFSNIWKGSMITTDGIGVFSNLGATGGSANSGVGNTVEVDRIAAGSGYGTFLEVGAGGIVLKNVNSGKAGSILIDSGAPPAMLVANRMPLARIYNSAGVPNMYFGQSLFDGTARVEQTAPLSVSAQQMTIATVGQPLLNMYLSSAAANEKYWRWMTLGGGSSNICLQTVNDAYTAGVSALCASRTGNTPTGISMPTLPTSAGTGGLTVCVDSTGNLYKKATCP